MLRRLNSRGDTIVEVLIAMTVVSAVLGGAYVSANRSLNAGRQSQERGEALKLVEGQVERLKSLGTSATSPIYNDPPPFCIDSANTFQSDTCSDSSLGVEYTLSIDRDSSDRLFTVSAQWDRIGGGNAEELQIVYKLHPTKP